MQWELKKNQLINLLQSLNFTALSDTASWEWDPSGVYTVHSFYNFLNFGGVKCTLIKSVWALKIPLKYKLFLWLSLNNRILTKDNLSKQGWRGTCGAPETVSHLFFHCNIIKDFWIKVLNGHPQGRNLSKDSLGDYWSSCLTLSVLDMKFWGTLLSAVLWVI